MIRTNVKIVFLLVLFVLAIPAYLLINHSDERNYLSTIFAYSNGAENDHDLSYGIIMDAGSTGTRLFLYCWRSTSDEDLIDIKPVFDNNNEAVVKKISPGLSTFKDKPTEAADYIKPLLEFAEIHVPTVQRPYTPVFIFATAGMRLVPEEQQKAILTNLHTKLPTMTSMQIMKEHIRVIEGKWEGIYNWISVNYVLGRFKTLSRYDSRDSPTAKDIYHSNSSDTVGMIDMGGASVQIAFELPSSNSFRSTNVENVNLGCRDDSDRFKYKLYVTTFLGYGVNEGLRKYEQYLSDEVKHTNGTYLRDECLPVNLQKIVTRDDGTQFTRKGVGSWDQCVNRLSSIIVGPSEPPTCKPECFFGHVPAPEISLSDMTFYGFSEYWFSLEDVLALGGKYDYSTIREKSNQFCSKRWSEIQSQARRRLYPKANNERLRMQCFKSAWITAILHKGFDVSKTNNNFRSALTIEGQEIQWALGAMIYHMRYFPLRDSQRRLRGGRMGENVLTIRGFDVMEFLSVIAIVLTVMYFFFFCSRLVGVHKTPYGYKMGSQYLAFNDVK